VRPWNNLVYWHWISDQARQSLHYWRQAFSILYRWDVSHKNYWVISIQYAFCCYYRQTPRRVSQRKYKITKNALQFARSMSTTNFSARSAQQSSLKLIWKIWFMYGKMDSVEFSCTPVPRGVVRYIVPELLWWP